MSNNTEIVRTLKIEDKIINVHIHLSEDEIRRLLLPHVITAFGSELRRLTGWGVTTSGSTTKYPLLQVEDVQNAEVCAESPL